MNPTLALFIFAAQILQPGVSNDQPKRPTASIEGFVRRAGTGEPIFKARVMLTGTTTAGATNAVPLAAPVQKSMTTEKDGHFSFTNLEAGKYSLVTYANSYVHQSYGQKTDNG